MLARACAIYVAGGVDTKESRTAADVLEQLDVGRR